MKSYILLLCALFALISAAFADVSEISGVQPVTEETVQKIKVLNPGEKEYLSPNLIGVQNIAITNIPLTMNFINIIDAYREVVDGVRYEILLNAVNTTDNNTEIICRLVVLEKPWLRTFWGDKVRLLQESNCTNEDLSDNYRDRKTLEEKYETNAIFTGNRNEITPDGMANLESQIISSSNSRLTRRSTTTTTTTTTESIITSEPEVVTESAIVTEPENSSIQPIDTIATTESDASVTTTEKIPELNDSEKKWLDDFLSIGAYNFETTRQDQNLGNNVAELREEETVKRAKRGIPGGVNELSEAETQEVQELVSKSLSKIAGGENVPKYSIDKVYSASRQVVAGTLYKMDCDLKDEDTGKTERCIVSLWTQPWIKENGSEVTVECKNKEKISRRHSRSVKESVPVLGGTRQLDADELEAEKQTVSKSLAKLATGDEQPISIVKVYSGTVQVVSGTVTKLDCDILDNKTGKPDRCMISLWSQPWLKEDGYEITLDCKERGKTSHRHSRSIDVASEKITKRSPKGAPKALTEDQLKEEGVKISESLTKIALGDAPSYSISRIFSGTKQTVAGSLVKIEAELIDGSTGNKENCTVTLWSRPWIPIDGYEVTFKCKDKQKSVHRHSRSVENIEKKTYKKINRSFDKVEHFFQKFKLKFNRTYHNTMEHQMRLRIFRQNLKIIQDLNKNEMGSAKYGITEFADMTTTEYRDRTGLLPREESNSVRTPAKIPDVELPREFDWREKGAVSKVKNQGSCGSCWAFSVTGNIEGLHAAKTGKLEEYSEQELLDCDSIDSACNGGLPDNAYQAIETIGGLELESQYPYKGKKQKCQYNSTLTRVKISGAVDLPKNETAIAQYLIANGPISVGINANAMQFYRGGVSHPWKILCNKKNLDHGVLIVGYGVSDYPNFNKTLPYWIIKNSWGPRWGEQGYYRVYRGDNTCGVGEMATSAILG